jgi:hypothetical protein
VIKYQAPADDRLYYYLFYSGHPMVGQNRYTHVYVARSLSVSGPWEKWNGSGWVVGESNPAPIIAPRQFTPVAPEEFVYGAGEQTVVVNPSGGLTMTYWDDTTCYPEYCPYEYTVTSSGSVTEWSTPIRTNLTLNSIDMKYDKAAGQYVAVGIDPQISNVGVMYKYTSLDAITWNQKAVIGSVAGGTLPNHPSNAGLSGDISGHLLPDSNFIGYAADYPGSACPDVETYGDCWGRWDLYQAPFKSEP